MKNRSFHNSMKRAPFVFVAPFILSFLIFYLYPIISTILMSFQEIVPGESHFIGTENYAKLFSEEFVKAVSISFQYTAYTILILIPLPAVLAIMLNNGLRKLNTVYRALFFLPSLVSVVVAGTIFRLMFAGSGKAVINSVGHWFGLPPVDWVMGGSTAMFLLVMVAVWRWLGVNIIYFMSGLQNIPEELYEAAQMDGAGMFQKFWRITLPLLKPTIIFVTTISVFGGFAMFEESYIFWQGNSPNNSGLTIVGLIYQKGFQLGDFGISSSIGLVLMVIVFIVSVVQLNLFGFFKKED
jgi:arabinosaccharide transport system permease protein